MADTNVATAEQAKMPVKLLAANEIAKEVKPLSDNAFLAFWQGLWRKWLSVWYGFADKHPKGSKLIYQVAFFLIFSNGVTIWQFLVMLFLPYAFTNLWYTPFIWPGVELGLTDAAGTVLFYAIFNEPVRYSLGSLALLANDADGINTLMANINSFMLAPAGSITANDVGLIFTNITDTKVLDDAAKAINEMIASLGEGETLADKAYVISGLGNFIAFEIAVFTAQCINLPLQRNITFKSKGNIWIQAMWYFIGWVGISIGVNALWGIMNPLMLSWNWNDAGIALLKTVITGGISMLVFFPIFLIIFPDLNKVAKKKQAKLDALVAKGAPAEEIAVATAAAEEAKKAYELDKAEKEMGKAITVASTRAVSFAAVTSNSEKAKAELAALEASADAKPEAIQKAKDKVALYAEKLPAAQESASAAIAEKYEAIENNEKTVAEYGTETATA